MLGRRTLFTQLEKSFISVTNISQPYAKLYTIQCLMRLKNVTVLKYRIIHWTSLITSAIVSDYFLLIAVLPSFYRCSLIRSESSLSLLRLYSRRSYVHWINNHMVFWSLYFDQCTYTNDDVSLNIYCTCITSIAFKFCQNAVTDV